MSALSGSLLTFSHILRRTVEPDSRQCVVCAKRGSYQWVGLFSAFFSHNHSFEKCVDIQYIITEININTTCTAFISEKIVGLSFVNFDFTGNFSSACLLCFLGHATFIYFHGWNALLFLECQRHQNDTSEEDCEDANTYHRYHQGFLLLYYTFTCKTSVTRQCLQKAPVFAIKPQRSPVTMFLVWITVCAMKQQTSESAGGVVLNHAMFTFQEDKFLPDSWVSLSTQIQIFTDPKSQRASHTSPLLTLCSSSYITREWGQYSGQINIIFLHWMLYATLQPV